MKRPYGFRRSAHPGAIGVGGVTRISKVTGSDIRRPKQVREFHIDLEREIERNGDDRRGRFEF